MPLGIDFKSSAGLVVLQSRSRCSRSEFSRMSDSFFLSAMFSVLDGRASPSVAPDGPLGQKRVAWFNATARGAGLGGFGVAGLVAPASSPGSESGRSGLRASQAIAPA